MFRPNQEDPKPFASKLTSEGHTIVAILENLNGVDDKKLLALLSEIASEVYETEIEGLSREMLKSFCNANCVCPTGWVRVEDISISPPKPYGTCVQASTVQADWATAAKECATKAKGTGFLASERSRLKHRFISDYVQISKAAAVSYHIGLSKNETATETAYYWQERAADGTRLNLQSSDFQPWAKGVTGEGSAVQVAPEGQDMRWFPIDRDAVKSYYVCEMAACDSENYCDEATLRGL